MVSFATVRGMLEDFRTSPEYALYPHDSGTPGHYQLHPPGTAPALQHSILFSPHTGEIEEINVTRQTNDQPPRTITDVHFNPTMDDVRIFLTWSGVLRDRNQVFLPEESDSAWSSDEQEDEQDEAFEDGLYITVDYLSDSGVETPPPYPAFVQ